MESRPRHSIAPVLALLGALASLSPAPAVGEEGGPNAALPPPEGPVLLVVGGDIALPNVGDEAHLDRATIESLPRTAFTTTTMWTDGEQRFEGVRLDTLLAAVGAGSTAFLAIALDDYRMMVEEVDLARYPVMVAYRRNGAAMSVRDLGPLWIMFPFDDHPELLTDSNMAMAVWQLLRMEVR